MHLRSNEVPPSMHLRSNDVPSSMYLRCKGPSACFLCSVGSSYGSRICSTTGGTRYWYKTANVRNDNNNMAQSSSSSSSSSPSTNTNDRTDRAPPRLYSVAVVEGAAGESFARPPYDQHPERTLFFHLRRKSTQMCHHQHQHHHHQHHHHQHHHQTITISTTTISTTTIIRTSCTKDDNAV